MILIPVRLLAHWLRGSFNSFLHIREDVPTPKTQKAVIGPYPHPLWGPVMVNGGYSRDLARGCRERHGRYRCFRATLYLNPDVQRLKDNVPLALPDTATRWWQPKVYRLSGSGDSGLLSKVCALGHFIITIP